MFCHIMTVYSVTFCVFLNVIKVVIYMLLLPDILRKPVLLTIFENILEEDEEYQKELQAIFDKIEAMTGDLSYPRDLYE